MKIELGQGLAASGSGVPSANASTEFVKCFQLVEIGSCPNRRQRVIVFERQLLFRPCRPVRNKPAWIDNRGLTVPEAQLLRTGEFTPPATVW